MKEDKRVEISSWVEELEGAHPAGAGPPPVLLSTGLRGPTRISVSCRRKKMEVEEEVRIGKWWARRAGAHPPAAVFLPLPQVSLVCCAPNPRLLFLSSLFSVWPLWTSAHFLSILSFFSHICLPLALSIPPEGPNPWAADRYWSVAC